MARTSYKTFLMVDTSTSSTPSWSKVCDIKDFPDLGKTPDTIDMTTLSDPMEWGMPDIEKTGTLEFTANYDSTTLASINDDKDTVKKYAVWFGGTESSGVVTPDGSEGKFAFSGRMSAYVKGAGVSASVDMTLSVVLTTAIVAAS